MTELENIRALERYDQWKKVKKMFCWNQTWMKILKTDYYAPNTKQKHEKKKQKKE